MSVSELNIKMVMFLFQSIICTKLSDLSEIQILHHPYLLYLHPPGEKNASKLR